MGSSHRLFQASGVARGCWPHLHAARQAAVIVGHAFAGRHLRRAGGWPNAGNGRAAGWAFAIRGEVVFAHQVTEAVDELLPAFRAIGVLPGADVAGGVAGIDKAQARFGADLRRADELRGSRVRRVGHLVVFVKGGDVPGNVAADGGEELRDLAQLGFTVVEAGHHQGDHLKPQPAVVDHADALSDVLQGAAQCAVALVVEALEVNLVGDNPGAQEIEHLGRGVAVRDEGAVEARFPGFAEDGHGPFGGDERLVVARHDQARAQAPAAGHQLPRGDGLDGGQRGVIAQGLAGNPVLAVGTVEVAAHHPERQRVAARIHMEEGLLLDRVALHARDVAKGNAQLAVLVEAHTANPMAPGGDEAAVAAHRCSHFIPSPVFKPGRPAITDQARRA